MGSVKRERDRLLQILREQFRLESFRPHQEEVCLAVTDGADALLVMPTGSGKSLCYQLPGAARGGTTLVVSPLIALIEDQVAKLQADGFRAERIHSGRERSDSRQVCVDYVEGALDFLFIAPERLSVPGFPELLARRKPTLIAVDEAHCISHWGHDFRPDYRLLGERLPLLRPAPIIALTATATVRVQRDIVQRLGMERPKLFIRGFWRDNLAVEARDCPKGERSAIVRELLLQPQALPGIVYVPTRKESDTLSAELADLDAVPYHAGMEAADRVRSQEAFMAGKARVVVATVAFGMGVDKADIRTVIHTGLTGSIESYYQEIGRAGRDGERARVYLLYSWSDRKLLEFLHSCSYPPLEFLRSVLKQVADELTPREELFPEEDEDEEKTEAALRQLYNHGAIVWTPDDRLQRVVGRRWSRTYVDQREHRLHQIEDMVGFAQSGACRMHGLVRYFSPDEAANKSCGICDHCAPQDARAREFQPPTERELRDLALVLETVRNLPGRTPRVLNETLLSRVNVDRDRFEGYLDCLARARLLRQETDSFEKEGRVITFQRLFVTALGSRIGSLADVELWLDAANAPVMVKPARGKAVRRRGAELERRTVRRSSAASEAEPHVEPAVSIRASACYEALRDWRVQAARERGCPPFRIASNATLKALSHEAPGSLEALKEIKGIGPARAREFGEEILAIIRAHRDD